MSRDRRSCRTSAGRILHRGSDNGEIQVRNRVASRCACPAFPSHLQFPLTFAVPSAYGGRQLTCCQASDHSPPVSARRFLYDSRPCHRDDGADGWATSRNKRIEKAPTKRSQVSRGRETTFLSSQQDGEKGKGA